MGELARHPWQARQQTVRRATNARVRRVLLGEDQLPLTRDAQAVIAASMPNEHLARGADEIFGRHPLELARRRGGGGRSAIRSNQNVVHGVLEDRVSPVWDQMIVILIWESRF